MNKSATDRIKITKNGKLIRRSMGVGHFRTRTTQKSIRNKRQLRSLGMSIKTLKNY